MNVFGKYQSERGDGKKEEGRRNPGNVEIINLKGGDGKKEEGTLRMWKRGEGNGIRHLISCKVANEEKP